MQLIFKLSIMMCLVILKETSERSADPRFFGNFIPRNKIQRGSEESRFKF
jgi:hypothetical protein